MTSSSDNGLSLAFTPVSEIATQNSRKYPEEGRALCLSGGGYRAMLFHTGSLWRLHEVGLLKEIKRISSVSGGSIVAALLGLKWGKVFSDRASTGSFVTEVVQPIRAFAHVNVDVTAIGKSAVLSGSASDYVSQFYAKHLYGDATLQSLPDDPPRFVINATNIQSGALWRFSKPYMQDYLLGRVTAPAVRLADAVAASSAFPPFLSPAKLDGRLFKWEQLGAQSLTTDIYLSDGGVYDNLGLETAWKRYKTLLVSDGGQKIQFDENPGRDWFQHTKRVFDVVDNQVRSLRKRQLIESFQNGVRTGTYWGIRTDIARYGVPTLLCPFDRTKKLAEISTRLSDVDDLTQERLINWGYAVCDAALRAWVDHDVAAAVKFPYEASQV